MHSVPCSRNSKTAWIQVSLAELRKSAAAQSNMAPSVDWADAPEGDAKKGAKIFKTKCSQCHVPEQGGGHKQVGHCLLGRHALRPLAANMVAAHSSATTV